MLIAATALVLLVLPAALGGRPDRIVSLRLRGVGLLPLALCLQVAVIGSTGARPVLAAGHVASYALLGAFVWLNRAVPGLRLAGLGAASNGLTIALNGGTLPAGTTASQVARIPLQLDGFANSSVLHRPRLLFLGDVIPVPAGPLSTAVSIGDVVLLAGVAVLALRVSGTLWTQPCNASAYRGSASAQNAISRSLACGSAIVTRTPSPEKARTTSPAAAHSAANRAARSPTPNQTKLAAESGTGQP